MAITSAFGLGLTSPRIARNATLGQAAQNSANLSHTLDTSDKTTDDDVVAAETAAANISFQEKLQQNITPMLSYAKTKAIDLFGFTMNITNTDAAVSATAVNPAAKQTPITKPLPAANNIRRMMKRVRPPEGMVLHYESRLRNFLGLAPVDGQQEFNDDEWLVVNQEDAVFTPVGKEMLFDEDDLVVLGQALARVQSTKAPGDSRHSRSNSAIAAGIRDNLVTEWTIQDSYTRLVVHNMCRYYGLVSFSNNLDNGKSVLRICHPRFFKDSDENAVPDVTFHEFLFATSNMGGR
ncbi:hypothetical protein GGI15_001196 [Coemansia interrupta]|uniref:R3H-associated N-terminal domain-containing protein n=1 Tax=Coemansia interrupta TaxID=1126814 RepID=A0A9W8HKG1_9FUNG|nr:hypothetical protein GGI15_001196 [Coemansia interrupta]